MPSFDYFKTALSHHNYDSLADALSQFYPEHFKDGIKCDLFVLASTLISDNYAEFDLSKACRDLQAIVRQSLIFNCVEASVPEALIEAI